MAQDIDKPIRAVIIESDDACRNRLGTILEELDIQTTIVEKEEQLSARQVEKAELWYVDLTHLAALFTDLKHSLGIRNDATVLVGADEADSPQSAEALASGAWDVLLKPFDIPVLERRLRMAIERVVLLRKSASSDALLAEAQNARTMESLSVLAGGMAHDFNNILAIILSNARALGKRPQNDASIRGMIIKATERAVGLTKQLVEYSGKGHYPLKPLPDLTPYLEQTIDELNANPGDRLKIDFVKSLDRLPVYADASQIVQLLKNLVINAMEAVENNGGEILVATKIVPAETLHIQETVLGDPIPEGDCVVITVKDSGCGIPKADHEKIFEPFFSTKFIGRGLGLSAVIGIVRRHGGAIHIESDTDQGTEVTVYLPVFRIVGKDENSSHPAVLSFGTILVVDDDEICRAMARTMLDKLGFATIIARDGIEALEQYQKNADRIDCILLDIVMPRMNGQACFREIRKLNPEVPIIMASGYDYYDAVKGLAKENLNGFITKPYRLKKLVTTLSEVLGVDLSVPAAL